MGQRRRARLPGSKSRFFCSYISVSSSKSLPTIRQPPLATTMPITRSINRPKMQARGSLQGCIVRHEPLPARTASKRCPICRISMSNIYRKTPDAYNVATKLFRNSDHEKLVGEATIFANRLAVRLRRIYADAVRSSGLAVECFPC